MFGQFCESQINICHFQFLENCNCLCCEVHLTHVHIFTCGYFIAGQILSCAVLPARSQPWLCELLCCMRYNRCVEWTTGGLWYPVPCTYEYEIWNWGKETFGYCEIVVSSPDHTSFHSFSPFLSCPSPFSLPPLPLPHTSPLLPPPPPLSLPLPPVKECFACNAGVPWWKPSWQPAEGDWLTRGGIHHGGCGELPAWVGGTTDWFLWLHVHCVCSDDCVLNHLALLPDPHMCACVTVW